MSAGSDATSKPPLKVFISSLSVNKEVKQQQQRIVQTLEVKKIAFDKKDIATDQQAKREFRMLIRGYSPNGSPPQIFNGDYFCGDYEAFYWAVEEERLEEFLRLVPPKVKPAAATQQQPPAGVTAESNTSPAELSQANGQNKTQPTESIVEPMSSANDDELAPPAPPAPPLQPQTAVVAPPPPPPPPLPKNTEVEKGIANNAKSETAKSTLVEKKTIG